MSRAVRTGAAALLCVLASSTRAAEPPCRAEVILEPGFAYLEQQVVYRLRMLRSAEVADVRWIDPPSFHSFRAEWLPGHAPDPGIEDVGEHRLVFEERRALFPVQAGKLATPRARMACLLEGREGTREVEFRIPSATLEVAEPPEAGRPPDWSGVVGRVEVRSTVPRTRLSLGESVELGVSVWGPANVWRVRPPFGEPPRIERAEIFSERPNLSLEAGSRLVARRSYRFDVVPRHEGPLQIPSVRIPYFDPATGRYAVAETPTLDLVVAAAAGESGGAGASESRGPRASHRAPTGRWLFAAIVVLLGAVLGLLGWRRSRPRGSDPATLLARAELARSHGDRTGEAALLARALRIALERRSAAPDPEARALLDALDAERFGREGVVGPDLERVHRAIARLGR